MGFLKITFSSFLEICCYTFCFASRPNQPICLNSPPYLLPCSSCLHGLYYFVLKYVVCRIAIAGSRSGYRLPYTPEDPPSDHLGVARTARFAPISWATVRPGYGGLDNARFHCHQQLLRSSCQACRQMDSLTPPWFGRPRDVQRFLATPSGFNNIWRPDIVTQEDCAALDSGAAS